MELRIFQLVCVIGKKFQRLPLGFWDPATNETNLLAEECNWKWEI